MTDDVGRVLPEGTGPPAAIPGPIFAAAVDTFVAGQRLGMRSLARRVGVSPFWTARPNRRGEPPRIGRLESGPV